MKYHVLMLSRACEYTDDGFQYAAFLMEDGHVIDCSLEYNDLFWNSTDEAMSHVKMVTKGPINEKDDN